MMSPEEKRKVLEECRRLEAELLKEQKRIKILQKDKQDDE